MVMSEELSKYTPTEAYVRDAFISECLRDRRFVDTGEGFPVPAVMKAQAAWHRWLVGRVSPVEGV